MPRTTITLTALPLAAIVALTALIFWVATGVGAVSALGLVLVIAIQGWAGAYVWARVRVGEADRAELVGMGLALGTALSMVSGLALLIGIGWMWGWILPAILVLAHWLWRGRRRAVGTAPTWERGGSWGVATAIGLGVLSLIPNVRSYPLSWTGVWGGYHGDMLFFEAVATSMARLGPLDSIFTPDALIRYHWLAYAWAGQVTEAVGAGPFVVLTRVLPFVAVVASCLIAVAWARRLTTVPAAPALAVILLVTGGYVGATYGAIFNFDSPSQSLTTLWLLALSVTAVAYVNAGVNAGSGRWGHAPWLALLGLFSFAMAGGKISAGAVGLVAVGWLALIGLLRRTEWSARAGLAMLAVGLAFVLGFVLVVMGSADPGGLKLFDVLDRASSIQGMNPIPGSFGIILGTGLLIIAIGSRWAGLLWFVGRYSSRWTPDTVLGSGFILAAVATVVVLSGGMNDTWFALAASAPLAVISAAGAAEAWFSFGAGRKTALAWLVLAALFVAALVWALWLTGPSGGSVWVSSWRWLAPLVGVGGAVVVGAFIGARFGAQRRLGAVAGAIVLLVLVAAPGRALGVGSGQMGVQPGLGNESFNPIVRFVDGIDGGYVREWSDQHQAAASFLRSSGNEEDLVATNVTFSPLVPALTGMQTWVSGMAYQAPYGRASGLGTLIDRERQSWAFVDQPAVTTAQALCDAGVTWVWVDPQRTEVRNWMPHGVIEFASADVILLRLDAARCE